MTKGLNMILNKEHFRNKLTVILIFLFMIFTSLPINAFASDLGYTLQDLERREYIQDILTHFDEDIILKHFENVCLKVKSDKDIKSAIEYMDDMGFSQINSSDGFGPIFSWGKYDKAQNNFIINVYEITEERWMRCGLNIHTVNKKTIGPNDEPISIQELTTGKSQYPSPPTDFESFAEAFYNKFNVVTPNLSDDFIGFMPENDRSKILSSLKVLNVNGENFYMLVVGPEKSGDGGTFNVHIFDAEKFKKWPEAMQSSLNEN